MVKIANVAGMTQIAKVANVMASMKKEKAVKVVSVVQIRRACAQGVLEPKPIILLYYPPYPPGATGTRNAYPQPWANPSPFPARWLPGCVQILIFGALALFSCHIRHPGSVQKS